MIGPSGSGKTALVMALNEEEGALRKTQNILYGKQTMDVPGSYLENPWMYKHLIAAAQDARHVLILVDQTRVSDAYAPGFAKVFTVPVTGVITKCESGKENEEGCIRQLKAIGIPAPYFRVSVQTGEGIRELKEHLFGKKEKGGGEMEIYHGRRPPGPISKRAIHRLQNRAGDQDHTWGEAISGGPRHPDVRERMLGKRRHQGKSGRSRD